MSDYSPSESESSSDDDDIPISQLKRTNLRSRSVSASSSSSSDSGPIISKRKRKRFGDSEEEDSDSSSSDDEPIIKAAKRIKPPPKKRRRASSTSKRPKRNASRSPKRNGVKGVGARECHDASTYPKKESIVPLKPSKGALHWWEQEDDLVVTYRADDDKKDKKKWTTLDHNGVVFAPDYVPHGKKMLYDGEEIDLCPEQEEIATMYAMIVGTPHEENEIFRKNFFKKFKQMLRDRKFPNQFPEIEDLKKCDFSRIIEWYKEKKEAIAEQRKDPEYKARVKEEKEEFDSKFGYALVDGILEPVGNYKVEPPALFRGRGSHPKTGTFKERVYPKDIILNIGEGVAIPPCPLEGQEWGGVIHDPTVTYIAKWVENVNGSHKFVYLGSSSGFKGRNDRNKYEKARVLKTKIKGIREDYEQKLKSKTKMTKQLATAVWMIDILSIRVGNEKDTDEEADTVGVCSLRKEHMVLLDPAETGGEFKITLDFLGKDSMRYFQTVKVTERVYRNLQEFLRGKKDDQDIFEKIDSGKVNEYLKEQMEGLTAKVFRTHNASTTLQNELERGYHKQCGNITLESSIDEKVFYYNQCNKEVAILCNHQRSVSKSHADQLQKMDEKMENLKASIKEKEEELEAARGTSKEEKLEKQLVKKRDMLRKKQLAKSMKEDNKEVALGTSKINYMDPRVTVAWCKRMQVPIEKVFNKSLLEKFPWAMQATTKYQF